MALRPSEWIKNLLIFAPAFFSVSILNQAHLIDLVFAFISFNFICSSEYLLNDLSDKKFDFQHPIKSRRAFHAGLINTKQLYLLVGICIFISIGIAMVVKGEFVKYIFYHFILFILYTSYFKNIPYIEFLFLVLSFLVRVFAGATVVDVPVTNWILIMVSIGTILLTTGKRRTELKYFLEHQKVLRAVITSYTLSVLNAIIVIFSLALIVFYYLYTMDPKTMDLFQTKKVVYTCIPAFLCLFRYLYIVFNQEKAISPANVILKDMLMYTLIITWIILFYYLIYGHK